MEAPARVHPGYGVHSEVGHLRSVLVCSPGLAHNRLTPSNCHDLLFDDVMWVDNARRDHAEFVGLMKERGIEVLELHALVAETLAIPAARQAALTFPVRARAASMARFPGWSMPRAAAHSWAS